MAPNGRRTRRGQVPRGGEWARRRPGPPPRSACRCGGGRARRPPRSFRAESPGAWVAPPGVLPLPLLIERLVAPEGDASRAEQRDRALFEGPSQRRPRNGARRLAADPCLDDLPGDELEVAI